MPRMCRRHNTLMLLICLALAGCGPAPAVPVPTGAPVPVPPTAASAPTRAPAAAPTSSPTRPPAPSALPEQPAPPAAAAPAGYVVYQRADGSLWRADGAGEQPIELAEPSEPEAVLPWAASPDGKTIAVVTGAGLWYRFHGNPTLALWLVGADGSSPRKVQDLLPPRGVDLTPGGDDAFNLVPALTGEQKLAWSPDGQLVAFVSAHEGQVDLYAAGLDGALRRLTDTPALEQGPVWSPDGVLLAYRTASGFGTGAGWGDVAVAITPCTGSASDYVVDNARLSAARAVALVPDLLWIDANTLIAGLWDQVAGNDEVRALTVGDRGEARVFDAPYSALAWNAATRQLAIAGTSARLAQSPLDGRALAPGLFAWNPGAGEPARIERDPAEALAWTPQGDALAFSAAGERPGLRLWSIGADGDLRELGGQPAQQLRWSADGRQLAAGGAIYGRDGKRLAALAGQQVYLLGWGPHGLFYFTLAGGSDHDLWLWDGAQARRIDSGIRQIANAGVVLAGQ